MRILGLSCDYHDAAAALIVDGEVVAAAEEERFSRLKHDSSLPEGATASVLAVGGVAADDLDAVILHEKPLAVFSRVLAARQRRGPRALGVFRREMPTMLGRNLLIGYRVDSMLRRLGARRPPRLLYGEHHLSHAAAAFYPSPFSTAAILTVDGIGEWATAAVGHGVQHRVDLLEEQQYPNSLGLVYSLLTEWCGFEANDGEYKLMGLAPFGEPTYADALREFVHLGENGAIEVDPDAVQWWSERPDRLSRLASLFDGPPREPGAPLTRREQDLARTAQEFVESAVLSMARHAHYLTGSPNLCLAGGVALNCVANARVLADGPFEQLWVQPAAGDAGSAVGVALWYWYSECGNARVLDSVDAAFVGDGFSGAQLGPAFEPDEIAAFLADEGVASTRIDDDDARCRLVAERLAAGDVVGWFDGRMEFGPRALGQRSILADPRSPTVQRDLNIRIKGRESFRPFAPAVLWERAGDWFDLTQPSPYMTRTCSVASSRLIPVADEPEDISARVGVPRSDIPACTHVDGTARVQTVHREISPLFHQLLSAFEELVGCPVLLNTSFNRAGEPIVCAPDDALTTARAAGLDLLVLGSCVVGPEELRRAQSPGSGGGDADGPQGP